MRRVVVIPYLFLLPLATILGSVVVYPWAWAFYLSFFSWNPTRGAAPTFLGLGNYVKLLGDTVFLDVIGRTVAMVAISVTVTMIVGLMLAVVLQRNIAGRRFFQTAFLLPMIISPAVGGLMWRMLLHTEWGLFRYFLSVTGLRNVDLLGNPKATLLLIIVLEIWLHTPFVFLVLYTGLRSLPGEYLEAAWIDGATESQAFRLVTFPILKPLIMLVLVFRIILSLRAFDSVYALFSSPGPGKAGRILGVYLYEQFRVFWELGRSSAIAYVLLLLTFVTAFPLIRGIARGGVE